MRLPILNPRELFSRKTLGSDIKAGIILGVQGVPDNLSSGVLAGVNPIAGVYAGIFGVAGAALFTGSMLMPVTATGALSIIVRDVDLGSGDEQASALAMLTILTGLFMLVAGVLRFGTVIRFVSRSVITGFIAAVGVNIILGQFFDITQYEAEGNRVAKAIITLLHIFEWEWAPVGVALVTAVSILVLRRTALGGLGYVVAIAIAWVLAYYLNRNESAVIVVNDFATIPNGLPLPVLPDFGQILQLSLPALSLAFVGLVQGAGVASSVSNPDGSEADVSQDFIGQGAGNLFSGFFRGKPVGGSASATVLNKTSGAGSRGALFFTSVVMAILVVALSDVVGLVPLAGLAGMLLIVGVDTIPVERVKRVLSTGRVPTVVMIVTFLLTLFVPLQYAVIVGVGFSVVLFTIGESQRLDLKRVIRGEDGSLREVEPPKTIEANEVILIQPYGTLFFASAKLLIDQLPQLGPESHRSAVIIRLRGEQSPSATLIASLSRYAQRLDEAGCRLVVVTTSPELVENLREGDVIDEGSGQAVYRGTDLIGEAAGRAVADAEEWVESSGS